jgi:epoxyqueuosine reductase
MLIDHNIIIKLGRQIQIDQLGVTSAVPLDGMRNILERRILEERITPFEEKNPALRLSANHLLSGCRSIITLAVPYNATSAQTVAIQPPGPKGLVARCARSSDYHQVVEEKATMLVSKIKDLGGKPFNYRILADRSPLMEREIARRSGLGLIGENCTLINSVYGSYVSICTILLDFEVETSFPVEDKCRQCGKCRESCPTAALTGPYVLNPYRCLSYLTQAAGTFPRELRSRLGARIYGCDLCQEVCPHNDDAAPSPLPEFNFDLFPAEPLLLPLMDLTRREFDTTIKLTAAGWRGKTTLQRNAVIALGNSGDPAALKPLARLLENDSRTVIRLHTAWALGRLGGKQARITLEKSAERDPDESVRLEALLALEN